MGLCTVRRRSGCRRVAELVLWYFTRFRVDLHSLFNGSTLDFGAPPCFTWTCRTVDLANGGHGSVAGDCTFDRVADELVLQTQGLTLARPVDELCELRVRSLNAYGTIEQIGQAGPLPPIQDEPSPSQPGPGSS